MQEPEFHIESLLECGDVKGECVLPPFSSSPEESLQWKARLKRDVFTPVQTHTANVKIVDSIDRDVSDTDALITFRKGFPIGVFTADCVPILLYSPDVEGIAAIHAGWKGTLSGIVENAIRLMMEKGADPEKMKAAFGPSISHRVYEVSDELAEKFIAAGFNDYVSYPDGIGLNPHLDLQGINIRRMLDCGLLMRNIKPHEGCSFSSQSSDGRFLYQSHRRSGGNPGRMLTQIAMY